MRLTHLAACAATLSLIAAPTALAKKQKDVDSSRLDRKVTVDGIVKHQEALQNIADMNGGTRYTRTAGGARSLSPAWPARSRPRSTPRRRRRRARSG